MTFNYNSNQAAIDTILSSIGTFETPSSTDQPNHHEPIDFTSQDVNSYPDTPTAIEISSSPLPSRPTPSPPARPRNTGGVHPYDNPRLSMNLGFNFNLNEPSPPSTMMMSDDTLPIPILEPPIQIRMKSQQAELARLDSEYEQQLHPSLDTDRMVGKGRVEARDGEEELTLREARQALDGHVNDRMGFVRLASERLQAVLGERNGLAFDLPDLPLNTAPLHRYSPNAHSPVTKNLSPASASRTRNDGGGDRRKDSGVGLQTRLPLSPLSPFGFGSQVDEETGKGLREWLLSRGKETGTQRKRECRSIAFHDFTPDMRTGGHSNVLVAHYNGDGLHERADVYEVDLPVTHTDPNTGTPTQATETWIWFLISRPLLSFSASDTSTHPPSTTPNSNLPGKSSHYDASLHPRHLRPSPNFNFPIPTSWLVFACPAANVTSYPDNKDDSVPQPHPSGPSDPVNERLSLSAGALSAFRFKRAERERGSKWIYKRKDYDFSHQGVPLFEFSCADMFPVPTRERIDFLSVEGMGGWHEEDLFEACGEKEWKDRMDDWGVEVDELSRAEERADERIGRDRSTEAPCAYQGVWWTKFYERVYEDEARWRRIREAMAKGKCRVVVRWSEFEDNAAAEDGGLGYGEGDEDMGGVDTESIGLGVRLNGGSLGSNSGKKIKERLAGRRAGVQGNRITRADTRRRSGLGVFSSSQENLGLGTSGILISGGMVGGGGGGGGGAKEKKIRKK